MDAWASRLTVVWSRVVVPLVLVGVVSAMIALTEQFADVTGLAVLYMAAVMIAAILGGRGAAVIAALAAFIAFDLFFILPRYTLTVANPAEWVTLSVLLLTGLVTGQLAALVRQRTREARANERASCLALAPGEIRHGPWYVESTHSNRVPTLLHAARGPRGFAIRPILLDRRATPGAARLEAVVL